MEVKKFYINEVNIYKDNSVILTIDDGRIGKGEIVYKTNQS